MPDRPYRLVLLIDDHDLTRLALTKLFRKSGFDVRAVPSGHAALHILENIRPDAVVLDLHLPDMEGNHLLRLMRSEPYFAGVPVLILSGDPDGLAEADPVGACDRLLKGSVSWDTLSRRLTSLVDPPSRGDEFTSPPWMP